MHCWATRHSNDYDGDYGTVLNRFPMQAAVGHPLTVHGTGGQTRAFINIQNTVQCLHLAIENPPAPGDRVQIFNQMTETYRVRDLAKMVAERTHARIENVANPRVEADENELHVANDRFLHLGLEPITLHGGLLDEISEIFGISMLLGGSGIETQVEILKSRDLVVSAIEASGLNAQIWRGGGGHPPSIRYWRWRFLDGKRLSAWAPGPQAIEARNAVVTDPGLADAPLTIRFASAGAYQVRYEGRTVLDGRLGEPAVGPGLRLLLQPTHAGFAPAPGAEYRLRVVRAVRLYRELRGEFGVSTTKPTLIVGLSYKGRDPYRAQRFLADLMRSYLAQNLRWSTEQAAAAYQYLGGQLHKMRGALEHADRRLADYKKTSGVIAVSADAKAMIGQLAEYQTQRSAAELRLYNLRQIARSLAGRHTNIDPYLLSAVADRVLDKLSGSLAAAQTELAALTPRETRHAPQVIQVRARIARIRASIRALIHNQKALAGHQVAALDRLIARFEQKLKKLPEAELRVVALTRSSEVLGKLYMFLLQKQQEAAISKAGTVSNNRILDQAETNARPVSPRARTRLTLGLFFGLFLGVSWVLGRALFTPGFRSEEELRRAYPTLDWYALLPHFHHRRKRAAAAFAPADPRSDFGEAIRTLRGNLYLSQRAGRDHLWMITSAAPGDGKSTITDNLAAVLAHDGKRVLLIDADLRKPQAHEHFGVPQAPGLSDVTEALFERIAEDDLLHVPLGDRRLVLVEFPYLMPAPRGIDALAALARAGYQPVLAHAERYRYLQGELDSWLERIARHGTWMQCNIGSLAGLYGAGPRALANDLLERGLPVLWGTDLHRPQQIERYIAPGLGCLGGLGRLNPVLDALEEADA